MGHIWGRENPDGPHVGPMNFAIWDVNAKSVHGFCEAIPQSGWWFGLFLLVREARVIQPGGTNA